MARYVWFLFFGISNQRNRSDYSFIRLPIKITANQSEFKHFFLHTVRCVFVTVLGVFSYCLLIFNLTSIANLYKMQQNYSNFLNVLRRLLRMI